MAPDAAFCGVDPIYHLLANGHLTCLLAVNHAIRLILPVKRGGRLGLYGRSKFQNAKKSRDVTQTFSALKVVVFLIGKLTLLTCL